MPSVAEKILKEVTEKLERITDDESDEENLHRVNDAKTIELFKLYHNLGNLMYHKEGQWNREDYKNHRKYIDAIIDFDCGGDANCEQYKQIFIEKSTIVNRPPKETVTPNVYNVQRMNFDAPKVSNIMIGLGGQKASKKSSRKAKSKKSRKSKKSKKSRRH